jgi:hypothetical protein
VRRVHIEQATQADISGGAVHRQLADARRARKRRARPDDHRDPDPGLVARFAFVAKPDPRIVLRFGHTEADDPIVSHPRQPADYTHTDGTAWTWKAREWRIVEGIQLRLYDREASGLRPALSAAQRLRNLAALPGPGTVPVPSKPPPQGPGAAPGAPGVPGPPRRRRNRRPDENE